MSEHKDTRTPVDVTTVKRKGITYTVRIYDMEAYQKNIARYATSEQAAPARHAPAPACNEQVRDRLLARKQKSRFQWAKEIDWNTIQARSA
jgi:hypothetical protein